MSQVMTQNENVDQIWIQYATKVLKSALWIITSLEQLSNYEFHCAQDTIDLLAGMLFVQNAEGNLLQVDTSSQILRKQWVCDAVSLFGGELSKMHEAEFHVFSDSV